MKTKEVKKKQGYGYINKAVLVEAIAAGKGLTEAGRLAGSQALTPKDTAFKVIQNPTIKKQIAEKLEEKTQMILDRIREEDVENASLSQKAVAIGIFIDKREQLAGYSPIQDAPNFVIDRVELMEKKEGIERKISLLGHNQPKETTNYNNIEE